MEERALIGRTGLAQKARRFPAIERQRRDSLVAVFPALNLRQFMVNYVALFPGINKIWFF
jgi:hypothetical protein